MESKIIFQTIKTLLHRIPRPIGEPIAFDSDSQKTKKPQAMPMHK